MLNCSLLSFGKSGLVVIFLFSKVKRRLEKKPPKRSTICTTPRFLMKTKGKDQKKGNKRAVRGGQKGENRAQTTSHQEKEEKKTKGQGLKKGNKTQKEGKEKHKKVSQKTTTETSGTKLQRWGRTFMHIYPVQ